MPPRTKKTESPMQGVLDFLAKNWLMLVGIFIAYPFIKRYIDNTAIDDLQSQSNALRDNPQELDNALNQLTTDKDYHNAAKIIYQSYSIPKDNWDWLKPSMWTENDEDAYLAITSIAKGKEVPQLLYDAYRLVSGNRDLFQDSQKYLDEDYFKIIFW
ncbi:hypothetical protein [Flavobacterium cerinum]|uniref:Uncharacterized protein n=1 Tax=Flavobacterium cerinum TaxID=2502784 RepID=A0A444HAN9_9FLAO|nr:hypothetical protein [Flavobacterium cerinum]RWX00401.1 hypothetical protein EPI11_08980 [Flavobacterium cerinum]